MALHDRFEKLEREFQNIQTRDFDSVSDTTDIAVVSDESEVVTDNVEAVMTKMYEKLIVDKVDSTENWFDLSVSEQKRLITEYIEQLIAEDGLLFLDQDFHLARVIDRILKQESEFLDLDLFLYGEDNKSVVYVYTSGDVYVENGGKCAKTDRTLDKFQLLKLKRNILRMRGLEPDASVSSLNFRYHDFLISAVFGENEFYILKKSSVKTFNLPILSNLASLKLNMLIIGVFNSGKSVCMERLLDIFSSKYMNKRPVLLQNSPYIMPENGNILSVNTEFLDEEDFVRIFNNVLRLNPDCLFVDNVRDKFLPSIFNSLKNISGSVRMSFRADSLSDCVERLSGMYASKYNTTVDFAKNKIFSNFNLIIELNDIYSADACFSNFYIVNSSDENVKFEKLEVSADSLASILAGFSESFNNDD